MCSKTYRELGGREVFAVKLLSQNVAAERADFLSPWTASRDLTHGTARARDLSAHRVSRGVWRRIYVIVRTLRRQHLRPAVGAGACLPIDDLPEPLAVDWQPLVRGDLEVAMHQGLAVVAYDCNAIRPLP